MQDPREDRLRAVAQEIAKLEQRDLLHFDDFASLVKALVAKYGHKNVSDSELDQKLEDLFYYWEPSPG